jgi:hypothetical protein
METPDPKSLSLPEAWLELVSKDKRPPRHKHGERFLKGPIPWEWITRAARLAGHAWHVGTALWFLAGLKRKRTVLLTSAVLDELGVGRRTGYRALEALEKAGLVEVERHVGRSPKVTILDVSKRNRTEEEPVLPLNRSEKQVAA